MSEGPTVRNHPAHSELVCTRCDFLKHNLVRSGRDPQWECLCLHPKAQETAQRIQPNIRVWGKSGNGADGCWIGERPSTPGWCPLLKRNRAEDALTCQNCGKEFSLLTCDIETGTVPNTLTDLPDHQTPHAKCPHCGFCR